MRLHCPRSKLQQTSLPVSSYLALKNCIRNEEFNKVLAGKKRVVLSLVLALILCKSAFFVLMQAIVLTMTIDA